MKNISGSGVALVTPFTHDNKINYDKLDELIEYHIKNETDFIVICGTTGESSTLSEDEKKEIIYHTSKKFKNKIPIIAGTGSNDTKKTINLSTFAKKANVDGLLIVTPYYNKCNQKGLYEHYKKIAESVYPLPIILYNVASRTCVDIALDTIIKLSKIENIIAIKEANPSLEKISQIIYNTQNNNFKVFSGNDNLTYPILSLGGDGVISVCANIIPKEMHLICKNHDKDLFFKYLNLMNNLFLDVNPIMIKEAMNYLNFDVGDVRLPLYKSDNEKINKLKNTIDEVI